MLTHEPYVGTDADLRRVIAPPSESIRKKKRAFLLPRAQTFIESSSFVGTAIRRPDGYVEVIAFDGEAGYARIPDDRTVLLTDPRRHLIADNDLDLASNPFIGLIFLAPGINETLRVNGRATMDADDDAADPTIRLFLQEAYFHCPRGLMRSGLWRTARDRQPAFGEAEFVADPDSSPRLTAQHLDFISRSPFVLLGSTLEDAAADVSPRGDPPGFARVLDDATLLIPDRPGNRLNDTFRNLIANPRVGVMFLIPGTPFILRIHGDVRISISRQLLAESQIDSKVPTVGLIIALLSARLETCGRSEHLRLWDADEQLSPSSPFTKAYEDLGALY